MKGPKKGSPVRLLGSGVGAASRVGGVPCSTPSCSFFHDSCNSINCCYSLRDLPSSAKSDPSPEQSQLSAQS